MTNAELIIIGIIIGFAVYGIGKQAVTYLIGKGKENGGDAKATILSLISDPVLQSRVLQIIGEISAGDFKTSEDYVNFIKAKASDAIFAYINNEMPKYASIVTEENIDAVLSILLDALGKTVSKLKDSYDESKEEKE